MNLEQRRALLNRLIKNNMLTQATIDTLKKVQPGDPNFHAQLKKIIFDVQPEKSEPLLEKELGQLVFEINLAEDHEHEMAREQSNKMEIEQLITKVPPQPDRSAGNDRSGSAYGETVPQGVLEVLETRHRQALEAQGLPQPPVRMEDLFDRHAPQLENVERPSRLNQAKEWMFKKFSKGVQPTHHNP